MAKDDNDWYALMQTRGARIALNGMGAVLCATNVIDAAVELMAGTHPEALVSAIGLPGYYALTIARLVICLVATCLFGRDVWRAYANADDDDGAR